MSRAQPRICIIGAGMSGILMAIRLLEEGYSHIHILEKGNAVGGTWRENTYPGLHCDVPSVSYRYSFEPYRHWDKRMSSGEDLRKYFEYVSAKYGISNRITFNTEVISATYLHRQWKIRTNNGKNLEADFLISACGVLHHPFTPTLKGAETFQGHSFHTARWDHSIDLRNKKVGIIGSGSTSAQLIKPLSEEAASLYVFQRTPQWIFPLANRKYTQLERKIAQFTPLYGKAIRTFWDRMTSVSSHVVTKKGVTRKFMQEIARKNVMQVKDPELRRKLTPDYEPYCKRIIISGDYYTYIQKPNVSVVIDPILHIEPQGIRTDKETIKLDALIYSTGFDTKAFIKPIKLTGLNGTTLDEAWKKGPVAYKSITIPSFPNFFMLQGPSAPVGNFSLIAIAEYQANYILECLKMYRKGKFTQLAPTQPATDAFNHQLKSAMKDTVWVTGCNSWYLTDDGTPLSWPWGQKDFRDAMKGPELMDYCLS
ncbi:hypothetical protein A9Q99_21070 [Gammaproteobacteria bacterium 45_16_T64]|nr:hypothetical protein A9Q99_21070 [Gammaproteobacteria bacterium 45_16_T64]